MSRYLGTDPNAEFVRVARIQDVPPGSMRHVEVDGRPVALFNLEGGIYALDNNCPHNGGPLSQGALDAETGQITCPWHAWTWDIRTGRAVAPPVSYRARIHQVRLEGDAILVSRYPV